MIDYHQLQEITDMLERKNPHWPQEKVRWIALQGMGVLRQR